MTHIRQRRDTAANWTSTNPVLQEGEVGWETNTRKAKLGDGSTAWVDLPYAVQPVGAVSSVAGKVGAVLLDRDDVGLGDVNNTPDSEKPVSVPQQIALDLKADLDSPELTGNPTAPTPTIGDNDTSIATTAFVAAAVAAAAVADTDSLVIGDLRIAWGTTDPLDMAGTAATAFPVSFPTPFSDEPVAMFLTVQTGTGNKLLADLGTGVNSPSASGFFAVVKTGDGTTSSATPTVHWLAFGPA